MSLSRQFQSLSDPSSRVLRAERLGRAAAQDALVHAEQERNGAELRGPLSTQLPRMVTDSRNVELSNALAGVAARDAAAARSLAAGESVDDPGALRAAAAVGAHVAVDAVRDQHNVVADREEEAAQADAARAAADANTAYLSVFFVKVSVCDNFVARQIHCSHLFATKIAK